MKKLLLLLVIFGSLNALAQGKITGLQEITSDDGIYYFHDIEDESQYVRADIYTPEKNPAEVPFVKESNFVAQVEGEGIESVKFAISWSPLNTSVNHLPPVYYIDNSPPFTPYGDTEDSFDSNRLEEGYYSIEAIPYTEKDGEGSPLNGTNISFTLYDYHYQYSPFLRLITSGRVLLDMSLEEEPVLGMNTFWRKRITFLALFGTGDPRPGRFILRKDGVILFDSGDSNSGTGFSMPSDFIFEPGAYEIEAFRNAALIENLERLIIPNTWKFTISDTKTYIPDDNFEQALIDQGYDDVLDDYAWTSNLEALEFINSENADITDVTGIETMINLKRLTLFNSTLEIIDLSKNTKLEVFSAGLANLSTLEISKNTELTSLLVKDSGLENIDLSQNTKLRFVDLSGNELQTLDFSNTPALLRLDVSNNMLTSLNLVGSWKLTEMNVINNPDLRCIDVANVEVALSQDNWHKDDSASYCSSPVDLTYVPDDNFEQALIDLGYDDVLDDYVATSRLEQVTELSFYLLDISDLTGIEPMINLKNLAVEDQQAPTVNHIDLSKNVNLETLVLSNNGIQTLNLQHNIKLKELAIEENAITELDLSNNKELTELTLVVTLVEALEVSELTKLTELTLVGTMVEAIEVSELTKLTELTLVDNQISTLEVSQLTELVELRVGEQIETLDVSDVTKLVKLDTKGSLNLFCIQVADVDTALSQPRWFIDDTASYSLDCSNTDDDNDGVVNDVDICPNTPAGEDVNVLGCSLSQLADLAVQNISIGMGSDPCSDTPNCYINVGVLQDVEINVTLVKNGTESIYDGPVSLMNPLFLENLTEGDYEICSTNPAIPGFEQCFQVSSSAIENSVSGSIVIQNTGQEYTLTLAGSRSYTATVNNNTYTYDFDSVAEQQITFPLEVGINAISITGILDCEEEDLTNVPDDNFEQALIDLGYDDVLDDYVATAKLAEITELSFYLLNIADLTGIEAMINLKNLAVEDQQAPTVNHIDLSKNVNLESLALLNNGISTLNLQHNIKLKELAILDNAIAELDLSNNKELTELTLVGTQIEVLDLSELTKLTELILIDDQVKVLDVSELTELVELRLGVEFETLDISELTKLVEFNTQGSYNLSCVQVTDVDAALSQPHWFIEDTTSYALNCSNSELTYVPDDNFEQALIDLGYDDVLDDYVLTENIENVTELDFNNKDIFDFTGLNDFISLETFSASLATFPNVPIEIDISELVNLINFSCTNCALISLNLTNNINLERVNISANEINEIDISTLTKLKRFVFGTGKLTTLNTTNNTLLEHLDLSANKLTTLDVSQNSSLQFLSTVGNGTTISCIQVANIEDALAQDRWFVENPENYSLDCSSDSGKISDSLPLFPTISNGLFTIENDKQLQIHGISVRGLSGTKVKYILINAKPEEINIDMEGVAKGMYIVRLQLASGKPILKKILIR